MSAFPVTAPSCSCSRILAINRYAGGQRRHSHRQIPRLAANSAGKIDQVILTDCCVLDSWWYVWRCTHWVCEQSKGYKAPEWTLIRMRMMSVLCC